MKKGMASLVLLNCMRAISVRASLIIFQQVLRCQQRVERIFFLDKLGSAFFPVDNTEGSSDLVSGFLCLFGCLQEGACRRTNIVHNDDSRPFRSIVTFDKPFSAMALGLFSYDESI